jgi:hypothetical protein
LKNFPHQINQIPKLVDGLSVFKKLLERSENVADDGILGYALAEAGVYTFRIRSRPIRQLIEKEKLKPLANQGPRTCARDLRRLFTLLGFVRVQSNVYEVTQLGNQMMAAGVDVAREEVRGIWGRALRELALLDEAGATSHPYRILLKLVGEKPGIHVSKLALALDADDDSGEEFQRVLQLADHRSWAAVLKGIGTSVHQARNAVKILPALARQIHDIEEREDGYYLTSKPATDRSQIETAPGHPSARVARRHRKVSASEIARTVVESGRGSTEPDQDSVVDLSGAISVRKDRTARHNEIVQRFALMLEKENFKLLEDPFDCLATKKEYPVLLAEVKTLDGTPEDEKSQVRIALAQLLYYEAFDVPQELAGLPLEKIAVFEVPISKEHIEFLEGYGCKVTWRDGEKFGGSQSALRLMGSAGLA